MPDACSELIDTLISRRKARGLTQRDVARCAKLAQPAVARMESKASTPQLDTLLKVAAALDCDLALVPRD